jgi:integrase
MQKSGVGVRTIRINHSVLHRALNQAIKRGLIGRNPADGVTVPRQVQAEMKIWEEGEITRFLIAIKGNRNEALFHLALKTGMRQGELLGLKWSDLDWTKGILRVQRQVQRINNKGFLFSEPKTRAGRRSIQLGEFTLQVLREHYKRQGLEKVLAGDRWVENDLVFPSSVGTPIDQRNLQRTYASLVKKAGVQKIRFHDLRHTAASVMLNHGIPVIVVSRILGHSRPSITLDIYGHLIHDMQVEAARIMDDAITPLEVSFERKGTGIAPIGDEDSLETQPLEEAGSGEIGSK